MTRARIAAGVIAVLIHAAAAAAGPPPASVSTQWLAERLSDPKLVIVDMSEGDLQYQRFHLPGALRLPYAALIKTRARDKVKVRLDDAELTALLGRVGIEAGQHVVVYDDMGGLNAGRLYWELERIGHTSVSVLEGGLVKWILEGRAVSNKPAARLPVRYGKTTGSTRDNEVDLSEVRKAVQDRAAVLIDVRSAEEYRGDRRDPRSGHLPGARHFPWELALDVEDGFVRPDETMLRARLAEAGVRDVQTRVILYCRSGHRASQTYWTLRSLGFENVKLYANSMNEYALEKAAPLRRGEKP